MRITRSAQTALALTVGATLMFSGGGVAQAAAHAPTSAPAVAQKADDRTKETRGGKQSGGKQSGGKGSGKGSVKDPLAGQRTSASAKAGNADREVRQIGLALAEAEALTSAHRDALGGAQAALATAVTEVRKQIAAATSSKRLQALGRTAQGLKKEAQNVRHVVEAVDPAAAAVVPAQAAAAALADELARAEREETDLTGLQQRIDAARSALAGPLAEAVEVVDGLVAQARTTDEEELESSGLRTLAEALTGPTAEVVAVTGEVRQLVDADVADPSEDQPSGGSTAPTTGDTTTPEPTNGENTTGDGGSATGEGSGA
ncbi:MAG: hypothetical protein M3P46_02120 [Actinomycetota bacterium]|nr:hypothetical protein [Actinomycetota bacterium]